MKKIRRMTAALTAALMLSGLAAVQTPVQAEQTPAIASVIAETELDMDMVIQQAQKNMPFSIWADQAKRMGIDPDSVELTLAQPHYVYDFITLEPIEDAVVLYGYNGDTPIVRFDIRRTEQLFNGEYYVSQCTPVSEPELAALENGEEFWLGVATVDYLPASLVYTDGAYYRTNINVGKLDYAWGELPVQNYTETVAPGTDVAAPAADAVDAMALLEELNQRPMSAAMVDYERTLRRVTGCSAEEVELGPAQRMYQFSDWKSFEENAGTTYSAYVYKDGEAVARLSISTEMTGAAYVHELNQSDEVLLAADAPYVLGYTYTGGMIWQPIVYMNDGYYEIDVATGELAQTPLAYAWGEMPAEAYTATGGGYGGGEAETPAATPSTFTAPYSVCGDVTFDGVLDLVDAVHLGKIAAGQVDLTDELLAAADTNGDGEVGAADQNTLLRFLVGQIKTLPYAE